MTGTVKALAGCQIQACAEETSFPLDMLAMFKEEPICQECYQDGGCGEVDKEGEPLTTWADLPAISLEDLVA